MIGLADCNNFFVSCERAVDPSLEGVPVVVLSNNDGCAISRSNEAKRMGVKMGQPAFQLRDLVQNGKLITLSGNHILYRNISLRIHDIFRRYVPATIDYSVDEAFLDMDGIPTERLAEIGEAIVDICLAEEHIPVTIGFAPTKTLAKIATETGKKGGHSVVVLSDPAMINNVISAMPIADLWGVGRRLTKRLYLTGIHTIGDFAASPLPRIRAMLGINGERTWLELHGEPCISLDHVDRQIQDSISETRTFPVDIDDFDYLRARIAIYCAHVSKRLRAMHALCSFIRVFLYTNRFHTENGFHTLDKTTEFDIPTHDAAVISQTGIKLLADIFNPMLQYKRAGVVLSGISPASISPSLFELPAQREIRLNRERLMHAVDSLNDGAGPHVVKLASQLTKGHIGHNDGYSSSFGAPSI